ncbi:hypothetical protein T07_12641 [Trichinella nelsoni]|uniref:Uncharacterized protein n=1 Tax=Trichinella nelsoni TaxID=6336 RepID=A0A0V0S3F7_9BILA|nr:hypothetical protein T07_12641 [Trichinella nelsoni]
MVLSVLTESDFVFKFYFEILNFKFIDIAKLEIVVQIALNHSAAHELPEILPLFKMKILNN